MHCPAHNKFISYADFPLQMSVQGSVWGLEAPGDVERTMSLEPMPIAAKNAKMPATTTICAHATWVQLQKKPAQTCH